MANVVSPYRRGALSLVLGCSFFLGVGSSAVLLSRASAQSMASPSTAPQVTLVAVGAYPQAVAVDLATNTVYTANNGLNSSSVVNGARCDAAHRSGCHRAAPYQDVGAVPSAVAVDQATDTVYVVNTTESLQGSVSVVNGAACNGRHTAGCTHYPHLPSAVPLGFEPNDIAVNEVTNTIYVDGGGRSLAVIDGRRCNGRDTKGCGHRPHTANIPAGAGAVAVDPLTHTVYVVDYATGILSLVDASTCNASDTTHCKPLPHTAKVGIHPWRITVDVATDTVYVTNFGDGTVSVIDGAACNAEKTTACGGRHDVIRVGEEPEAVAVDDVNGLGFVTNAGSDTVSVFHTSTCDARDTSGCANRPATVKVGPLPAGIVVDPGTDTVYVADNASNTLAMFEGVMP
ncbi:MAG: YncE family protein [Acidimicrobiales bacterium]|jgi:DNA-binding beta-propeller fold protein YncE